MNGLLKRKYISFTFFTQLTFVGHAARIPQLQILLSVQTDCQLLKSPTHQNQLKSYF